MESQENMNQADKMTQKGQTLPNSLCLRYAMAIDTLNKLS